MNCESDCCLYTHFPASSWISNRFHWPAVTSSPHNVKTSSATSLYGKIWLANSQKEWGCCRLLCPCMEVIREVTQSSVESWVSGQQAGQIWDQSGSNWPKMEQIRYFFRSDFSTFWLTKPKWPKKVPDLSRIWDKSVNHGVRPVTFFTLLLIVPALPRLQGCRKYRSIVKIVTLFYSINKRVKEIDEKGQIKKEIL